mgnify:CR=1 FL=1
MAFMYLMSLPPIMSLFVAMSYSTVTESICYVDSLARFFLPYCRAAPSTVTDCTPSRKR